MRLLNVYLTQSRKVAKKPLFLPRMSRSVAVLCDFAALRESGGLSLAARDVSRLVNQRDELGAVAVFVGADVGFGLFEDAVEGR